MNSSRMVIPSASRKSDRELQEKLYMNIALLNMTHEPSSEFKEVFKKDMFSRSNKAAFLHVVHYLLTVLNPQMATEKLVTWPTCNIIKRENKFKTEVLQYIHEVNKLYEDADLPTMMSSHLQAPGGYRFTYFMYKLSQLVLSEDLKRDYSYEVLRRPKQTENEALNEKAYQSLVKCTQEINLETNELIQKFEEVFDEFQTKAEKKVEEKDEVHKELKEIKEKIETETKGSELSEEEINKKIEGVEKKFKTAEKISDLFNECKNFIGHLKENRDCGILDLNEALKVTNINMRRQLSELPDYEIPELESYLQILEEKREELNVVKKQLKFKQDAFVQTMSRSEEILKTVLEELKDV